MAASTRPARTRLSGIFALVRFLYVPSLSFSLPHSHNLSAPMSMCLMAGQNGTAGSLDGDSGASASSVTLATPFGLAQQSNGFIWLSESVSFSFYFHPSHGF